MSKVFAYRQTSASGFPRDAMTLFFYELGSPDTASPIVILPENTSEIVARDVLRTLGCELVEWD